MLREIEGVGTSQNVQPNEKGATQKQISVTTDQSTESEGMAMLSGASGEGGGATEGGGGATVNVDGAADDVEEGGATIMTAAQKKAAKKEREKKKKEAARQARLAQQNKQERATNAKEDGENHSAMSEDGSKSQDKHDEQVSVKCELCNFQEVHVDGSGS